MKPAGPDAVTAAGSRSESAAHRGLKQLALAWARSQRLVLAATEVRLPRSNYRADVAAATPRSLHANARTAVFECKVSRADFRRDSAREKGEAVRLAELAQRLSALRALIGGHRPDLRRGEELFAEFDAVDLRGVRHRTHARLEAEFRIAQRRLYEGTKFARLARWRAASLLYLVAEENLFAPHEVPDGWGLLIRREAGLELVMRPRLHVTTAEERVALVERIAAVASRAEDAVKGAGKNPDETAGDRPDSG